jgi:hypothetical protein
VARTRAGDELWAWYLEWSQIIRTAVKNRRLLQQLGFLSRKGGVLVEDGGGEAVDGSGETMDGGVPTPPAVATTARPATHG